RRILLDHAGGKLDEKHVMQYASAKRFEETVAVLSIMTAIPADVVETLMGADRVDPLLILCKALGFEWSVARALIQLKRGSRVSPDDLTHACDDFSKLSRASAQEVMRFWQKRQTVPA